MRATGLAAFGLFGVLAVSGALVALAHTGGAKGRLPPLGERAYVVDDEHPAAPVAIERLKEAGVTEREAGAVLKDPLQPGQVKTPKPDRVAHKKPKPASAPVMRTAQLRFRKMDVTGRPRQPRVEFTRDYLPLDRADEPVSQDFYQKVYEPVRDDRF